MLFKFTLSNTIEGNHVITDPDGWKDIKLKLEREKEYHSIIEVVELPLIFYRTSDSVDGGYDYIINVEATQGIDAVIGILIEVSQDQGNSYETFFQGLLLLETVKDISDAVAYKLECNIARTSLWSKFFSRRTQDVNLNASVDLDGNAVTPVSFLSLQLPGQTLPKTTLYRGSESDTHVFFTGASLNMYSQVGLPLIQNEIKDSFTIPFNLDTTAASVINVIEVTEAGTVLEVSTTNGGMRFVASVAAGVITSVTGNLYCRKNAGADILVATTTEVVGTSSTNKLCSLTGSHTFTDVVVGDLIYVWANWNLAVTTNPTTTTTTLSFDDMNVSIVQAVTYIDTATDAYLLRDAAESILSKIIGQNNVLNSEYLGVTTNGCASNFVVMKGLHVRGYSMNDKPMTMSFDDWWNGSNPIFNLGLGYETILGVDYIRIEDKAYFYDETPSLTLDFVEKITRTYDKDSIFKSIEIGYDKWSAESYSGVDDPQTRHSYNTRFKIIGKDEKVLSRFVAASLAIEQTRRNRAELGRDWRLDEDIMIISLVNDASPFIPETDQEFTGITDLLYSDTRYNIRLTPARNFERWKAFFNGCLQSYMGEFFKFGSGEGNIKTQTTGIGTCDAGTLAEDQDIAITTDYYHGAAQYEFEDDLTWEDYKTIRDNPTKAIFVSMTDSGHNTFFISELEWDHFNSKAKFTGWIK